MAPPISSCPRDPMIACQEARQAVSLISGLSIPSRHWIVNGSQVTPIRRLPHAAQDRPQYELQKAVLRGRREYLVTGLGRGDPGGDPSRLSVALKVAVEA